MNSGAQEAITSLSPGYQRVQEKLSILTLRNIFSAASMFHFLAEIRRILAEYVKVKQLQVPYL